MSESQIPDAAAAADLVMPKTDFSAIAAVCDADPRLQRRLRASLAVIARRTDDRELRQLCVAVLNGSTSVRRVFEHPAFREMASTAADRVQEGLDRLEPDKRDEVMANLGSRELSEEAAFALMEGRPRPE